MVGWLGQVGGQDAAPQLAGLCVGSNTARGRISSQLHVQPVGSQLHLQPAPLPALPCPTEGAWPTVRRSAWTFTQRLPTPTCRLKSQPRRRRAARQRRRRRRRRAATSAAPRVQLVGQGGSLWAPLRGTLSHLIGSLVPPLHPPATTSDVNQQHWLVHKVARSRTTGVRVLRCCCHRSFPVGLRRACRRFLCSLVVILLQFGLQELQHTPPCAMLAKQLAAAPFWPPHLVSTTRQSTQTAFAASAAGDPRTSQGGVPPPPPPPLPPPLQQEQQAAPWAMSTYYTKKLERRTDALGNIISSADTVAAPPGWSRDSQVQLAAQALSAELGSDAAALLEQARRGAPGAPRCRQ